MITDALIGSVGNLLRVVAVLRVKLYLEQLSSILFPASVR